MGATRQVLQAAFVLHQYAYRDSSKLLEIYSRDYGRVGVIARGMRGKQNRQLLLQPFSPLLLSWSGRGELKTLTDVESTNNEPGVLQGQVLISAFYINELMLRLLRRDDPHPELYDYYVQSITYLRKIPVGQDENIQIVLRLFERYLLNELGYGLMLDCDADGEAIDRQTCYDYVLSLGPVRSGFSKAGLGCSIKGSSLLALSRGELDLTAARDVRPLMRKAIDAQLGDKPLHSRKMLMDMLTGLGRG